MSARIAWSKAAIADMDEIWFSIAPDSVGAATRLIERLNAKAELLTETPMMGRSRAELGDDLLSLVLDRYLLIYRAAETGDRVEIVRVLHGSRNLANLFD